jgi:hypothetical protein
VGTDESNLRGAREEVKSRKPAAGLTLQAWPRVPKRSSFRSSRGTLAAALTGVMAALLERDRL